MSKLTAVEVILTTGERTLIPVDSVIGAYAIHPRVFRAKPSGPGWTVTHIASGINVWTVLHYAEALSIARMLDSAKLIPEENPAFEKWQAAMTLVDRTRLYARLAAIAKPYRDTSAELFS